MQATPTPLSLSAPRGWQAGKGQGIWHAYGRSAGKREGKAGRGLHKAGVGVQLGKAGKGQGVGSGQQGQGKGVVQPLQAGERLRARGRQNHGARQAGGQGTTAGGKGAGRHQGTEQQARQAATVAGGAGRHWAGRQGGRKGQVATHTMARARQVRGRQVGSARQGKGARHGHGTTVPTKATRARR